MQPESQVRICQHDPRREIFGHVSARRSRVNQDIVTPQIAHELLGPFAPSVRHNEVSETRSLNRLLSWPVNGNPVEALALEGNLEVTPGIRSNHDDR